MATYDELLSRLKVLEALLAHVNVRASLEEARSLAASIARDVDSTSIADLALKLVAGIEELQRRPGDVRTEDIPLQKALWRLRLALAEAKRDQSK